MEASYALAYDLDTGLSLCNQFEQDAIFWINSGSLNIASKDGISNHFIDQWENRLLVNHATQPNK